jgi:hypothetical protein
MDPLKKVFHLLNITEFDVPHCYALRLNGKRVFSNKWETGSAYIKEINQETLWQIVGLLKLSQGINSANSIEDFMLVKYIEPYVIRINFPPTSTDYYIDIFKIGTQTVTWEKLSSLWENKSSFRWLRDFLQELNINSNHSLFIGKNCDL